MIYLVYPSVHLIFICSICYSICFLFSSHICYYYHLVNLYSLLTLLFAQSVLAILLYQIYLCLHYYLAIINTMCVDSILLFAILSLQFDICWLLSLQFAIISPICCLICIIITILSIILTLQFHRFNPSFYSNKIIIKISKIWIIDCNYQTGYGLGKITK